MDRLQCVARVNCLDIIILLKGPDTRNDIVDDPSSTMGFNVAKIAPA